MKALLSDQVTDPEKACFSVSDFRNSSMSVGESSIRSVIGKFDYDDITGDRNNINFKLQEVIGSSIHKWGIECTRFEVQEFVPKDSHIRQTLEKQMEAERSRRENELNTVARIKTAEGEKQEQIYKAEGKKQEQILKADGEAYRLTANAKALSERIKMLSDALGCNDKAVNFLLQTERIDAMKQIANSSNSNTYFIDPNNILPTGKVLSDMNNKTG